MSFAAAHRELEAMRAAGLTVAERHGVATVYRANLAHPQAGVLTALLTAAPPVRVGADEQELRGRLAALGAPLGGPAPRSRQVPAEEVLAEALVLAHHSPTVARVLPVVFWRRREKLDHGGLRDGRRTALRPFFSAGRGPLALAAAREKSPALARRWGFLMNMDLESFATAFRKHVSAAG